MKLTGVFGYAAGPSIVVLVVIQVRDLFCTVSGDHDSYDDYDKCSILSVGIFLGGTCPLLIPARQAAGQKEEVNLNSILIFRSKLPPVQRAGSGVFNM